MSTMSKHSVNNSWSTSTWAMVVTGAAVLAVGTHMYRRGKVYKNKIAHCKSGCGAVAASTPSASDGFCAIAFPKLSLPPSLRQETLQFLRSTDKDPTVARRVYIPSVRAGRTVACRTLVQRLPSVIRWYEEARVAVSRAIGHEVHPTPLHLPTSCCILVYDQQDDGIEWHFDVNYFRGRFFTVLVPISLDSTDTVFQYKDPDARTVNIDMQSSQYADRSVLFEGDLVWHKASRIGAGQYRAVLSLQYSTDPALSWRNRLLMFLKDRAFVGSGY